MQVTLGRRRSSTTTTRKPKPPSLRRWIVACGALLTAATVQLARVTYDDPFGPWRPFQWIVVGGLLGAAVWFVKAKQRKELWGDVAFLWWVWHWFTGTPLIFVNDPVKPLWSDLATCWPFLDTVRAERCPEHRKLECIAQRALAGLSRTGIVAAGILAEYARSGAPHGTGPRTLATWGLGGTAALFLWIMACTFGAIGSARWAWWFHPLHMALYERVGWPANKRPRRWLHIPRHFEAERPPWRIRLWPTRKVWTKARRGLWLSFPLDVSLSVDNKTKTEGQVFAVLGLHPNATEITWDPVGRHSWLMVKPARPVPELVKLSWPKVRAAYDKCTDRWSYVVGFTNGWQAVEQSIFDQAPHVLIAGPSKTGKSQLLKLIMWQLLTKWHRHAAAHRLADRQPRVFVLDVKGYSHDELEDRPGVTYARTPAEMRAALLAIDELGQARGEKLLEARRRRRLGEPVDEPEFPPCFVIFEDQSAVFQQIRESDARQAWDRILALGRGVAIHGFAMPHRPDMKYLGQGATRDNLGNVTLMSGHAGEAKKMVAADADYEIPPEKRGRVVVIDGLRGIHTQCTLDDAGVTDAAWDQLLGPVQARPDQLLPAAEGSAPADDQVGAAAAAVGDHMGAGSRLAVTEPEPGGDMPLEDRVTVGELAGPTGMRIPGGAQAVGDVVGSLVSLSSEGQQPADDAGHRGGAHAPILTGVRADLNGQSATEATQGNRQAVRGQRTSPPGGLRPDVATSGLPDRGAGAGLAPESPGVMGGSLQPRHRAAAGRVPQPSTHPGGAGVMATPPQPLGHPPDPSPPQTHSPSTSRAGVRLGRGGDGVGVGQVAGSQAVLGDGPDPVTLRECWERAELGQSAGIGHGVEYESVRRAARRARAGVADGLLGAWFPDQLQTAPGELEFRVLANGARAPLYEATDLVHWWKSRPRSEPDDGEWWVYWMVQGGLTQLHYGCVCKVGYTNDLPQRAADFGNNYPGDVLHAEKHKSKAAARKAEKDHHTRYGSWIADGRGKCPEGHGLRVYPLGGGGKGGREQFYTEGPLADDLARWCPSRSTRRAS